MHSHSPFVAAVLVALSIPFAAVHADDAAWSPSEAEVDSIAKTQLALYDLETVVGQLVTPVSVRDAIEVIGRQKLRWSGHSGPAQMGGRKIRDAEQIYEVIAPELDGLGYVVVFRGDELHRPDGVVKKAMVGFRTPAGRIYYADLWFVKDHDVKTKAGEPGATDNPDDAQRLREDL